MARQMAQHEMDSQQRLGYQVQDMYEKNDEMDMDQDMGQDEEEYLAM